MEEALQNRDEFELAYFACPLCRITFKTEGVSETAIQCPGCSFLISLKVGSKTMRSTYDFLVEQDDAGAAEWEKNEVAEIKQSSPSKAILIILITGCVVGIAGVFYNVLLNQVPVTHAERNVIFDDVTEVVSSDFVDDQQAVQLGENYLRASSSDVIWQSIDQSRVDKNDFKAFYSSNPLINTPSTVDHIDTVNLESGSLRIRYKADVENKELFFRAVGNSYKLDWESAVGFSKNSAQQLQDNKKSEVELRVTYMPSNNYDFTFLEESWKCFKLKSTDSYSSIFGYIEWSETELIKKLPMGYSETGGKAIVVLEKVPQAEGYFQFRIKDVLADNWFKP